MTRSSPQDRIFVAGHRGMVGSALLRLFSRDHSDVLLTADRGSLDLTSQAQVEAYFRDHAITSVYLAAARVGGIHANSARPADFITDNLLIQTNVIRAAHRAGVKRLLFLGSSCIYPRLANQPIREEALMTGALEPTNDAYAVAKIAGIKMCEAYRRQHGRDFRSVMPTNLYGPNDNFDLVSSHVLPALLRKFHQATLEGAERVPVWGSGRPRREFLHVDDMAAACVHVMNLSEEDYWGAVSEHCSHLNVGCGEDIAIGDLARLIAGETGFGGEIGFDTGKPDGTPRKLLDVSRLRSLGWKPRIGLREGVRDTLGWMVERWEAITGAERPE